MIEQLKFNHPPRRHLTRRNTLLTSLIGRDSNLERSCWSHTLKRQILWPSIPFLLLFIGDVRLPIYGSTITIPLGMFLIFPASLLLLARAKLLPCRPAALIVGVLAFGVLGSALTPLSQATRVAAGSLPLVFVAVTLFVYAQYRISYDQAVKFMFIGGIFLSIAVIVLALISLGTEGGYYEQKLVIETPLGRSNYLTAFLIFLVALSIPRSAWLTALFSVSVACTMSRGGMFMLLLLFIAVPLAHRRKLWWIGIGGLAAFLAIAYIAATGAVDVIEWFIEPGDERLDSTINRMLLWALGIDLWSSNPIFGIGPNTFRTFVESADGLEDVWGVHNSVLLMILNYGIAGLFLYGCYLRIVYRSILDAERVDGRFTHIRAVFAVLLIFSLFEPLIGSAAFEILLALTYILSKSALHPVQLTQRPQHNNTFLSPPEQ